MAELEDLRAENAELSRRVKSLEQALADKPVVGRSALYALVDALPLIVATVEPSGAAGYLSKGFEPWLLPGAPETAPFLDRLAPALRDVLAPLLSEAMGGAGQGSKADVKNPGGEIRHLSLAITPRKDPGGAVNGLIVVGQDTTERQRADEALAESEARLRLVVDGAKVGAYDTDLATGKAVWSASAFAMLGMRPTPNGRASLDGWLGRLHPEDRERVAQEHAAAIEAGEPWQMTYRILRGDTGETRWLTAYGRFVKRPGIPPRSVGMIVDVTNEKLAEARQRLLLNELNHRVKNTLAAVQAIARSTLRGLPGAEAAINLFTARLMALSSAHDVLTRETWEGAGLREIVTGAARAHQNDGEGRFRIEGEDVRIGPKTAVALAMALHELATNAAKYGALSNDCGRVIVRWEARGEGAARRLELEWREIGGPPVSGPGRGGFGSRLLRQGLKLELGASAQMAFEASGLVCVIHAPLADAEAEAPE